MSYDNVIYECHGDVATITLDRPKTLNALSAALRADLHAAIDEVAGNDDIRVLILTGAGRGFCSGVDLGDTGSEEGLSSQNSRLDEFNWMGRQALAVYGLNKPTIAVMNGVAAGAGMSLALACDLRVGSEKSRYKTIFLERSNSTDAGMSFFLPRIVGYSRAADLIFTSRSVDAEEAYRLGLLDRMFAHDQLMEESMKLAREMAFWPPLALRSAKRVLQHNSEAHLEEALRYEVSGLVYARRAPKDVLESSLSFKEKRPPKFTGE